MATKLSTLSLNTDNASKISENTQKHQSFKVLLIGEKKVGKTAIINRFVKNEFISSYKMTVGAIQSNFECEVPIDLIEEIPEDVNLVRSMTSFLRQVNENERADLIAAATAVTPVSTSDTNDKTDAHHMQSQSSSSSVTSITSITDYGKWSKWSKPELISQNDNTNSCTRKTSIALQISLDIIDIGFHSLNETKLFQNVNAIILVCDYTKKSSFVECVEKYKVFLKNLGFGQNKIQKKEYIPVIVAINKSDLKKTKGEIKKKQLKKLISEKLRPIIDEHFFPQQNINPNQSNNNSLLSVNDTISSVNKQRNSPNSTLLQAPNLSFIFDEVKDDIADIDIDRDSDEKKNENENENENEEKQTKKRNKISKTDIRYIDIISCSAKTGKNIEKLFGDCIKKTLPSKLKQSVTSHQRTKTTAHVTAPIWLRKVFDDIGGGSTNQLIAFGDDATQKIDDNFDFIDDD